MKAWMELSKGFFACTTFSYKMVARFLGLTDLEELFGVQMILMRQLSKEGWL